MHANSKPHYCDDLFYLFLFNTGVEKKNDDLRRYFHRKINRWDAAKNLLLVEKRQEELRDAERTRRQYGKRNHSFWFEGGKQEAAQKVPRISTMTPPSATERPTQQPVEQQPLVEALLKKKTVTELLVLLEERTGRRLNRRTRKQDVITALMLSSRTEWDAYDGQWPTQHHNGSFRSHQMIKRNDLYNFHVSLHALAQHFGSFQSNIIQAHCDSIHAY